MEKLSELKRVQYLFTNPYRAMKDIAAQRGFALPITLMLAIPLLTVALNTAYYRDFLYRTMVTTYQQMNVQVSQQALMQIVTTQQYVTLATTPLMILATWLVFSLAVYLISMPFAGEEEMGYKTVLSITGYTFVVTSFSYILNGINMYFFPKTILTYSVYDIVNMVSPIENLVLKVGLQAFSLFRFWQYALVGVGLYAAKRISKKKAVMIMLLLFVLYLIFVCAQGALFPSTIPNI